MKRVFRRVQDILGFRAEVVMEGKEKPMEVMQVGQRGTEPVQSARQTSHS
jgi:hypothetical protein